jgi:CHAT domain-containing protein/lipopolysaccharide biosynthesis regulator YciM
MKQDSTPRRTGFASLTLWLALLSQSSALGVPQSPAALETSTLEVGKPIEREIGGGQTHSYRIRLDAGQILKAVVEQKGVDVAVALVGPDGATVLEVDSPYGAEGPEPVFVVVGAAGEYRLDVKLLDPADKGGRYEARIDEIRAATEKDRQLVEAAKLYGQAVPMSDEGKRKEAFPLAERAVALYEAALDADHPDLASALFLLGDLYRVEGMHTKAEPLFARALRIYEKAYGPEHFEVAITLNNLALVHQELGAYAKAEPLYVRALALAEKLLGAEHRNVATARTNLASVYRDQGEYAKAEPLYAQAATIFEKALGPDHPALAGAFGNLASLYRLQGAYAKAVPLLERSVRIYERALGPEHPELANSLTVLGSLYRDQGMYEKAEPLLVRALGIVEHAFDADHPTVAIALNHLGVLYRDRGELAKAEPLLARALAIREKVLGPEHPFVAVSLDNLAQLYQAQGAYAKAEPLSARALTVYERSVGTEHRFLATSLNTLADVYASTGRVADAVRTQARANQVRERELALNLTSGSEQRKLQYLNLTAAELDRTLSLQTRLAPADPAARRMALEVVLRRKGRALDAMTDAVETLRRHASGEDQVLLEQLGKARQQLSQLSLAGPGAAGAEAHRAALSALERQVEELEGRVSGRSIEFRAVLQPVTLASVQRAIPRGAVLVEFAAYRPFDPSAARSLRDGRYAPPRYVAYLMSDGGDPRWVDLGDTASIDAAVARLRTALADPKRRDVRRLARALDERVFRPVRAAVGTARHLLVAPDGALNLVPFGALVDERGRYLVESYELTYLTSGRDLLRVDARAQPRQPALVVADPAYGDPSLASTAETRDIVQKAAESGAAASDFGDIAFPPLAYTAEEARALSEVLEASTVLTGEAATERALKGAQAPTVVHVATHGFFLGTRDAGSGPRVTALENPLLRSGLALAGANARRSGEDDGVLTAAEVAGLDLWGTKLVVLSACNTGVGEVRTGDGVYGLRRALVLAGSESQVMSLWAVSDRATRDLMVGYYRGLLRGEGRTEALRRVQLAMLGEARTRHPFYWAGFIQSGAWTPLAER